jgi:hypothetical protein
LIEKNKRPPGIGSLLLSYVAFSSVETIMLDGILTHIPYFVNSFLKNFQKNFPVFSMLLFAFAVFGKTAKATGNIYPPAHKKLLHFCVYRIIIDTRGDNRPPKEVLCASIVCYAPRRFC